MPSRQRGLRSAQAMALSLLMASTSGLPALAAAPLAAQTRHAELSGSHGPLIAESDSDDNDKKKKKKKKKQADQKRPNQQPRQQQAQPIRTKGSSTSNTKPAEKTKQAPDDKPEKKKLSDKQREKIYQEGRQDGLRKGKDKGYEKGRDAGYGEGFSQGKKKGKDKAYREVQRQQWKAWNRNDWQRYNRSRRNIWVAPVQYNRGFYGYPAWAQSPNWGYNRPYGGNGWYSYNNSPSWSWWGGQALGWGINALTTALIVNNALNNAIRQRQPTVVVPNSSMQLYYGSVEPIAGTDATFVVNYDGSTYQMEADCADGLLDGEVPTTLAEAELINTVCQVAFGTI